MSVWMCILYLGFTVNCNHVIVPKNGYFSELLAFNSRLFCQPLLVKFGDSTEN